MLLKYLDNQEEWADILQSVLFAYRTSKHASTGFSPFFLLYNRHPKLPVDLMVEDEPKETSVEEKIEAMEKVRHAAMGDSYSTDTTKNDTTVNPDKEIEVLKEDCQSAISCSEPGTTDTATDLKEKGDTMERVKEKAAANISKAQEVQKRSYNKRCNPNNFSIGDEVLLEEVKDKNRCGGKLASRYTGPYEIVDVIRAGVYRLQKETKVFKKSVNGNRLKPYFRREDPVEETVDEEQILPQKKVCAPMVPDKNLEDMLRPRYWLTDREINAAQTLLQNLNPKCGGLQDTCLSSYSRFKRMNRDFLQIYNANSNHWVLLSTIGCEASQVNIFDSLYRFVHPDTAEVIGQLLDTHETKITIKMPKVQRQSNGSSCGLYAIAFAASILTGKCPSSVTYEQSHMREHLRRCFENRKMEEFPSSQKVSFLTEKTFTIDFNCKCRKPDSRIMKICTGCKAKCHSTCLWQDMKCDIWGGGGGFPFTPELVRFCIGDHPMYIFFIPTHP